MSTPCCSTRPARSPSATARRPNFCALPGVDEAELADAAQFASLSDETPEGRSIVVLAKEKYGLRGREMAPLDARFVPFSAQTRMSGIDVDGVSIRKGAVDSIIAYAEGGSSGPLWRSAASGAQAALRAAPVSDAVRQTTLIAERIAKEGGTPLAVAKDERLLGRHSPQGHRQGRHPRALRRIAADGHSHGHDHRRQSADRRGDRRRIRGRRFPGPGDARGQARADPRGAGQGQARRDVRRRHQRRAGTRAGGCRRGDEHRHDGGARGRQHGRSRQRSHQADRDRRDRQATADDPRRVDDVLDRQRRGEVFRDHPGDVRRRSIRSSACSTSCVCTARRARSCRR